MRESQSERWGVREGEHCSAGAGGDGEGREPGRNLPGTRFTATTASPGRARGGAVGPSGGAAWVPTLSVAVSDILGYCLEPLCLSVPIFKGKLIIAPTS